MGDSNTKKAPISNNSGKPTQTYLDEGLYQGPAASAAAASSSSVELSMKIPRPKHCSRHSDLFQSSTENDGNGETFHSDNYLQAATKNKKRTSSRLSAASAENNHAVTTVAPSAAQ